MNKKVLVIANTEAGSAFQTVDQLVELLDTYRIDYSLHKIATPPEAESVVEKANTDHISHIMSFGGDGTTAVIVKAAAKKNIPVLPLRGGSANGVASSVGIAVDLEACIQAYGSKSYVIQRFPLASVGKEPLLLDFHFGMVSKSITSTPQGAKKWLGDNAYHINTLKTAATESKEKYRIKIDGKLFDFEAYGIFVANINNMSFRGVKILPELRPGYLRMVALNSRNPMVWFRWYFIKRITGRSLSEAATYWYAKKIEFLVAPSQLIFDDHETDVRLPLVADAETDHVKIIIPIVKRRGITRFRSWIRTEYYRRVDHIRRLITGIPSVRFSQVESNLYLGGQYGKSALNMFAERGVTGIVSMREYEPDKIDEKINIEILHLPTRDMTAPAIDSLRKGVSFIKRHIDTGGSVYVHCRMGEGRGPTMAAAYLISTGMSTEQALLHLRHYRPFARPNKKQVRILKEFEDDVKL